MLSLTVGFSRSPRVAPLIEGLVKPQGMELRFVVCRPGELFFRNLKYEEFDVFEMSMSEYLMTRERRDGSKWQWTALPVFPAKAFLWLQLYVNTGSGIEGLAELRGKRVGVPDYPMTAALWMRAFLKELYDIEPKEIAWHNGRPFSYSHSGIMRLDENPPAGVKIHWLKEGDTLDQALGRGEIDAAYSITPGRRPEPSLFSAIDRYGGTPIEANPRIRRLLPDSGRAIVLEYYRRTGVLPANHLVVAKNSLLQKHPWVALELFHAFQASKELAYRRAREMSGAYLLFEGEDLKRQAELFGPDPYPYGLSANRKMLETLARASFEQGLTKEQARVDELFHPTTLDT
ncbi:MAG TPA: PhnD/SsuA/transferrin family substrate-binding protein [Candidatus Acidoferrales bacterium]|nr:PhnD/SsuA/transferrin family substrate-binding protein [Candidatus Acidoferrales bacterium]